jgi:hypothetical protein
MIMATALLLAGTTTACIKCVLWPNDGQLFNIKSWAFGLNKLFGRKGVD